MSGGALWQDLKLGVEHLRAWKRIALVTDIEWMAHLTDLFGWMTPGETKVFPLARRDEAIQWVAAKLTIEPMDRQLLLDGVAYADQWLAHQREFREIPGMVVAIQHDDDVLPGEWLRPCQPRARDTDDPAAHLPHRFALEDIHGHGHHAARRAWSGPPGRSRVGVRAMVRGAGDGPPTAEPRRRHHPRWRRRDFLAPRAAIPRQGRSA